MDIPERTVTDDELEAECGAQASPDCEAALRRDAEWLFRWRDDGVRPQDRCHAYLRARDVCRRGGDSAQVACVLDLCRRAEALGSEERAAVLSDAIGSALDVVEALRGLGA